MDTYMTTSEVAKLARTSPETVRYWRHVGRGPEGHFRVGRRVLYDRARVEAWLRALQAAEVPDWLTNDQHRTAPAARVTDVGS